MTQHVLPDHTDMITVEIYNIPTADIPHLAKTLGAVCYTDNKLIFIQYTEAQIKSKLENKHLTYLIMEDNNV